VAPPSAERSVRQVPSCWDLQTSYKPKAGDKDDGGFNFHGQKRENDTCLDQRPRRQALSLDSRLRAHAELHGPRHQDNRTTSRLRHFKVTRHVAQNDDGASRLHPAAEPEQRYNAMVDEPNPTLWALRTCSSFHVRRPGATTST
jgi:hypothetical protein